MSYHLATQAGGDLVQNSQYYKMYYLAGLLQMVPPQTLACSPSQLALMVAFALEVFILLMFALALNSTFEVADPSFKASSSCSSEASYPWGSFVELIPALLRLG